MTAIDPWNAAPDIDPWDFARPLLANCERCGDDFPQTADDPLDPEYTRCPNCADHDVLCGCTDPDCTNGVI